MGVPPRRYAVAISATEKNVECAAALYRRLREWLEKDEVFFWKANGLPDPSLCEATLGHVYTNCEVLVALVDDKYAEKSATEWEMSILAGRVRETAITKSAAELETRTEHEVAENVREASRNENRFAIWLHPHIDLPTGLEMAARHARYLAPCIRGARWPLDVAAKDAIDRLNVLRQRQHLERLRQRTQHLTCPTPVKRHLPSKFLMDLWGPNAPSSSSEVARSAVECAAAVLGTAEQHARAVEVVLGLQGLVHATNPLAHAKSARTHRLARTKFALETLVEAMCHVGERKHQAREHETLLCPDECELWLRFCHFLRRHELTPPPEFEDDVRRIWATPPALKKTQEAELDMLLDTLNLKATAMLQTASMWLSKRQVPRSQEMKNARTAEEAEASLAALGKRAAVTLQRQSGAEGAAPV
jgi:hypothetical protein